MQQMNEDIPGYKLAGVAQLLINIVGDGSFRLFGGRDPHVVRCNLAARECECDCVDFKYHGPNCKHVIAVRRLLGDPLVVSQLGPTPETHSRKVRSLDELWAVEDDEDGMEVELC